MALKVSIIIPTRNAGSRLIMCLEGINMQLCDCEKEIIVVDSQSVDNTIDIARSYRAGVVKIDAQDFTHGRARNMGASVSKGNYLVFCNQDAVPANANWLQNLILPLDRKSTAGSYSRQIAPAGVPRFESLFLQRYYPKESRINTQCILSNRPEDYVLFSTVSAALRKDIWDEFKFNEKIIMSEDQEIACRILLRGYNIAYASESVVLHGHSYSLSNAFKRYFDSGWSMRSIPRITPHNPARNLHFFVSMCKDILSDNDASTISRASGVMHLVAKSLGFGLGQLAPNMPATLRSKLSYTTKARSLDRPL